MLFLYFHFAPFFSLLALFLALQFLLFCFYVKEVFIVDIAIFEELLSILMKLFFPNFLSNFHYFLIEHGLASFAGEQFNDGVVG